MTTKDLTDQSSCLRIVTYNIRFVLDRWKEREHILKQVIADCDADIYALQEVNIGSKQFGQDVKINQILNSHICFPSVGFREYAETIPLIGFIFKIWISQYIFDQMARFNECFLETIVGSYVQFLYHSLIGSILYLFLGTAWCFGSALFCRSSLTPSDHERFKFGHWRVASKIVAKYRNRKIAVVNVHLTDGAKGKQIRVKQVLSILQWLQKVIKNTDGVIILGDFNATPDEDCLKVLTQAGFRSAYFEAHNREPDLTFHQNHEAITKDVGPELCLDYIFYRGCLNVSKISINSGVKAKDSNSVWLCGTEPSPNDPKLYPSDHFGVVANFIVS